MDLIPRRRPTGEEYRNDPEGALMMEFFFDLQQITLYLQQTLRTPRMQPISEELLRSLESARLLFHDFLHIGEVPSEEVYDWISTIQQMFTQLFVEGIWNPRDFPEEEIRFWAPRMTQSLRSARMFVPRRRR